MVVAVLVVVEVAPAAVAIPVVVLGAVVAAVAIL